MSMSDFDFGNMFGGYHGYGGAGILAALSGIFIVLLLILIAIMVIVYVFESLGLYTMAKRRGIPYYGLAWVPVANMWVFGKLADQYDNFKKGSNMHLTQILLYGDIGLTVLYIIAAIANSAVMMMILWMPAIALAVFEFIALYKIYHAASPSASVALLVCSILFTIVMPFALFALRNKDEGYAQGYAPAGPAPQAPPQYQQPQYQQQPQQPQQPIQYTQAPPQPAQQPENAAPAAPAASEAPATAAPEAPAPAAPAEPAAPAAPADDEKPPYDGEN